LLISMWTRGGDATARQMVRISRKRIAASSRPRTPYCSGLPRPPTRAIFTGSARRESYLVHWWVVLIEVVSKPVLTYFSLLKLENDCTAQPEKAATQRYSRALVVPLHPAWPVLMRG
jgi:hypothetical protein